MFMNQINQKSKLRQGLTIENQKKVGVCYCVIFVNYSITYKKDEVYWYSLYTNFRIFNIFRWHYIFNK